MKYFAYGSNLLTERLQRRVPTARPAGIGRVRGHRLCFHMTGTDGSGKCNALPVAAGDHGVWGAVYEIDPAEKPCLDAAESLGIGYDIVDVTVETGDGPWQAYLYRAREECIDDTLAPFVWYRNFVLAGARQKALPNAYVHAIAAVAAQLDPDPTRQRLNHRILMAGDGGSLLR